MPELVKCKQCKDVVPVKTRKDDGRSKKVIWVDNIGQDGVCVACMEKATK